MTLTPNTGYHVKSLKVAGTTRTDDLTDGANGSKTYTFTLKKDTTVEADFEADSTGPVDPTPVTHTVTVNKTGNGTVTLAPAATPEENVYTYNENTEITVTVTPETGHRVKSFKVGGTDATLANGTTYTIEHLTANVTIAVEFEAIPVTHTVTVNKTGNGTVTLNPNGTVAGDVHTYNENTAITVTVTPETGHRVKSFKVGGTDATLANGTTYTIEHLTADVTIAVEFAEIPELAGKWSGDFTKQQLLDGGITEKFLEDAGDTFPNEFSLAFYVASVEEAAEGNPLAILTIMEEIADVAEPAQDAPATTDAEEGPTTPQRLLVCIYWTLVEGTGGDYKPSLPVPFLLRWKEGTLYWLLPKGEIEAPSEDGEAQQAADTSADDETATVEYAEFALTYTAFGDPLDLHGILWAQGSNDVYKFDFDEHTLKRNGAVVSPTPSEDDPTAADSILFLSVGEYIVVYVDGDSYFMIYEEGETYYALYAGDQKPSELRDEINSSLIGKWSGEFDTQNLTQAGVSEEVLTEMRTALLGSASGDFTVTFNVEPVEKLEKDTAKIALFNVVLVFTSKQTGDTAKNIYKFVQLTLQPDSNDYLVDSIPFGLRLKDDALFMIIKKTSDGTEYAEFALTHTAFDESLRGIGTYWAEAQGHIYEINFATARLEYDGRIDGSTDLFYIGEYVVMYYDYNNESFVIYGDGEKYYADYMGYPLPLAKGPKERVTITVVVVDGPEELSSLVTFNDPSELFSDETDDGYTYTFWKGEKMIELSVSSTSDYDVTVKLGDTVLTLVEGADTEGSWSGWLNYHIENLNEDATLTITYVKKSKA